MISIHGMRFDIRWKTSVFKKRHYTRLTLHKFYLFLFVNTEFGRWEQKEQG